MVKVHYNTETGDVIAAFDSGCPEIPVPNVAVTEEVWNAAIGKVLRVTEGQFVASDPAPTLVDYELAVQAHLDETAQSLGYDNSYTCLSYLQSTNPKWSAESAAFSAWRDSVWLACHAALNAVSEGSRTAPAISELLMELPGFSAE